MNVFLSDFHTRLRAWHTLKESLKDTDIQTICVEVDKFWQQCPMNAHYLHIADVDDWPNPWTLLSDNEYCNYARGLGMVYTLLLLGIKYIDFVDAIDDNRENVVLVVVDYAKYVLNYWPGSVLNMNLSDFTIVRYIDTSSLKKKIGE